MPSIEKLASLLSREPDDVFLNFALGMELAKQGRVDEAAAQFDRVVSLDGDYCAAFFQKGRMLAGAGRREDARAALEAGIAAATRSGNAHAADEMREFLASL